MAYNGFISYSHAADDRLAPALQRGLQRLAKPWNSRRALRIFRDETGLSTNPHLWSAIEKALDESEWFVLLASEEAARSEWVNKEISHWLTTKAVDRILPVVTGGTWEWDPATRAFTATSSAVPEALRSTLSDEPRHLDLRWARTETDLDLRNTRFRSAVADLAAPMHGVDKDELEGEDIRQHRRARRLARAGVATVVVLLVVSVVVALFALGQRNQADLQRTQAERATDTALANGLSATSGEFSRSGQRDLALLLGVEAVHFADRLGPTSAEAKTARYALLGALSAQPSVRGLLSGQPGTLAAVSYSPDGRLVVSQSTSGDLRVWNAATGQPLAHQPPPTAGASGALALTNGGLLVTSAAARQPTRIWDTKTNRAWRWQPHGGAIRYSGLEYPQTPVALSPNGVLAVGSWVSGETTSSLALWNINTGQAVSPPLTLSGALDTVAFSPDGSQLAADVISPGGATFDLVLVHASTGAIERRFAAHPGPGPATRFAPVFDQVVFSADGQRVSSVVSDTVGGAIATFDTATGTRVGGTTLQPPNVVGVSADLRELVTLTNNGTDVAVVDSGTGRDLADAPYDNTSVLAAVPLALDPVNANLVYQTGPGTALAVLNWTQVGAPHLAAAPSLRRMGSDVVISPRGKAIDMSALLRRLGVGRGTNPRDTVHPAVSETGAVGIIVGTRIVVMDSGLQRVARTLTGAPGCWSGTTLFAFVGSPRHGRIVLACNGWLRSWDLSNARSSPSWVDAVAPNLAFTVAPVMSSGGGTVAFVDTSGSDIIDGRTGKVRADGPTIQGADEINRMALSANGKLLATLPIDGSPSLIDTTNGDLVRTLTGPNEGEQGYPGTDELAFSPNGANLAVWQDGNGLQLWDVASGQLVAKLDGRPTEAFASLVPGDVPGETVDPDLYARDLVVSFSSRSDAVTVTDAEGLVNDATGTTSTGVRSVTWSLRTDDWITAACTIVGRDLTRTEWNRYIGVSVPYHRTCTPILRRAER